MITLLEHNLYGKEPHTKCPAVFYLRCGSIFTSVGFNGKHSFKTKYFMIEKNDVKSGCFYLRLLESYKCSQLILIPSETCIVIDKKFMCGSQLLPDIPMKNHVHKPICIKDCMCGLFAFYQVIMKPFCGMGILRDPSVVL